MAASFDAGWVRSYLQAALRPFGADAAFLRAIPSSSGDGKAASSFAGSSPHSRFGRKGDRGEAATAASTRRAGGIEGSRLTFAATAESSPADHSGRDEGPGDAAGKENPRVSPVLSCDKNAACDLF